MKKNHFTKKEVAELTGLVPSTVNFYTEKEIITPDIDNPKGRGKTRLYSYENLVEFLIVKYLKSCGLGLDIIKKVMSFISKNAIEKRQKWWKDRIDGKASQENAYCLIYDPTTDNPEVKFQTSLDTHLETVDGVKYTLNKYLEGHTMLIAFDLSAIVEKILKNTEI